MKSNALFVDDEPLVLSGLRRTLRSLRHDWEIHFCNSGREALELLAQEPFTVVVSDMRMPEMDGAALLNEVADRYPAMARIILSGHAELDAILRTIGPAHQYLSKPCDPRSLEGALQSIRNVCKDQQMGAVCNSLGTYRGLPSQLEAIEKLRAALTETRVDLSEVAAIVNSDIAISLQLLRLVNSAFFGPTTKTFDPRKAVSVLGPDILNCLVNDVELFRPITNSAEQGEASVIKLNNIAAQLGGMADDVSAISQAESQAKVFAMMLLAGPLAALEVSDLQNEDEKQAFGRLLLTYWGLNVDTTDLVATLNKATEIDPMFRDVSVGGGSVFADTG